jgi:hypothetical protein
MHQLVFHKLPWGKKNTLATLWTGDFWDFFKDANLEKKNIVLPVQLPVCRPGGATVFDMGLDGLFRPKE